MDNLNGFIKIHRKLLKWEWYSDINVRVLFFHCLLRANHKSERWQGIEINAGQFVTSYEHLAKECGLTVQQLRTALNKLKITNEITNKTTSRYSIITVNNWKRYQTNNKQSTNNQQTNNNKQEVKEEQEDKKINLSLSNSSTRARVGKREREILKSYCMNPKNNIKNPDGFIASVIKNGDYLGIIEQETKRIERQKQRESQKVENFVNPDNPADIENAMNNARNVIKMIRKEIKG